MSNLMSVSFTGKKRNIASCHWGATWVGKTKKKGKEIIANLFIQEMVDTYFLGASHSKLCNTSCEPETSAPAFISLTLGSCVWQKAERAWW